MSDKKKVIYKALMTTSVFSAVNISKVVELMKDKFDFLFW